MVLLIVLVAVVATLDRGVLSLVIDPVRHDLRISDIQVSLLQGLSFSLFYATVGVVLGLCTDRVARCRLLGIGILLWSMATIAAGLSTSFGWMFLSRLLVGMGEGTLGPCAISLICDLFPPNRRGRPMGLFLTGQAISNGLSVLMTGAILRHLPNNLSLAMPGILHNGPLVLHPWRVAFIVCGLLGMTTVPVMLMAREPARRETVAGAARLSAGTSLRLLVLRHRVLLPLYLGLASVAAGFYGTLAWGAVSITRRFGLHIIQVTGILGPASIVAGLCGPSLIGMLIDRMMDRDGDGARLKLLVLMPLLAFPAILCAFAPTPVLATLCLATMMGAYPALATVFFSVLQGAVPNNLRGFAVSLTGLMNAIIGATGGPLLIAMLSQHAYAGPAATGFSLSTVLIVTMAAGSFFFAIASRRQRQQAIQSSRETADGASFLRAARNA